MGSTVAAMLILGLLLSVITLMGRSTIVSSGIMERASTAALERAAARANTNFTIESTTAFGTTTTVKLKNTGSTSASDFAHMDFIATYVSGGSAVNTRLTYTASALLGANQWKKSSISPDNLEQDTWNQTETLTLLARLSSSPDPSTTATFAIGTPDGVSRTVSVSVAVPINDTFEFDSIKGKAPNIIFISGDVYAIAYSDDDDFGTLKTVQISGSGDIRDEELDTLVFDPVQGKDPNIIPISGDVYAIAYSGDSDGGGPLKDTGTLKTVTIATDGQITDTVIDTLVFDAGKGKSPNVIPISGNVYAIAYEDTDKDGLLKTVTVATNGQITDTVIDTLEFDTTEGKKPNITPVSGDVYGIVYEAAGGVGTLKTITVATDGQITDTVIDTLVFDAVKGKSPNIIPISGNVYAIAYEDDAKDGFLKTVTIATNGQITDAVIDTLEFDTTEGKKPNIIQVAGDVYVVAYEGPGGGGFLKTITIATDGQITDTVIDTLEYDTSQGKTPNIIPVSGVYAIAYEGNGGAGTLQTVEITTSGQMP